MHDNEFRTQVYTSRTKETRLCVDPWSLIFIRANGDVHPCCHAQPVGSIEKNTLEDIIDSEELRWYRIGLYTGNLTISCQYCPARRKCSLEELHKALEKYQKTGEKVL